MRVVVTGGAGFIGSHLSESLVSEGYSISIIDNLFRGKYNNIAHLIDENNRFYNLDLSKNDNIQVLAELLCDEQPCCIFHYAAINGTQYFYDIPHNVFENNSQSTYCLMQAVKKAKCKLADVWNPKVIYASSSEVYGEPFFIPTKEEDITHVNINHTRDSYAASKLFGEFSVKLSCDEMNLPWIILRLFNVYGPRMVGTKYGQVIPEFITRLRSGEYPLSMYGRGEYTRSFCYITDNIAYTLQLAKSNAANEIFNIGSSQEVSISELATLLMKKMDLEPQFHYLEERAGDHKRRCPDTKKLMDEIHADSYITLDVGLDRMLESYTNES